VAQNIVRYSKDDSLLFIHRDHLGPAVVAREALGLAPLALWLVLGTIYLLPLAFAAANKQR